MAVSRRAFLRAGAAAAAAAAPGPAPLSAPADMVTLLAKKAVDAIIAWQPITDAVVFRGEGVYLAKQIDLWRKATGRPTGFPVHVCYLVHGEFLQKHPAIARDLNEAQRDAVDVWYNKPARAMEIVQEVTKLPADVVQVAHRETVGSGAVWLHTGASLARILVGFGGAVAAAIVLGLAAFVSRLARGVVGDALAILNATSVFVWIVISIIWFGLSNWAPIFTTFMITLPVVASNIVEGVANVDRRLLEMGDAYHLSGREKFRSIVVPSTLPYLIAGMKVGFGLALKVSVVAEIFGVTSGIGYIMNYSREILATQMVFVWALVMILVMMATDTIVFDALSRRVARWR